MGRELQPCSHRIGWIGSSSQDETRLWQWGWSKSDKTPVPTSRTPPSMASALVESPSLRKQPSPPLPHLLKTKPSTSNNQPTHHISISLPLLLNPLHPPANATLQSHTLSHIIFPSYPPTLNPTILLKPLKLDLRYLTPHQVKSRQGDRSTSCSLERHPLGFSHSSALLCLLFR